MSKCYICNELHEDYQIDKDQELSKARSIIAVYEEGLTNISNCRHVPNCGYVHAPCVCHRRFADDAIARAREIK